MIIERINVYTMASELPRPFAFSQQWVTRRSATLVEVVTQDGQSGWGEALCAGLLEPELAAAVRLHQTGHSSTLQHYPRVKVGRAGPSGHSL